MHYHYLILLGGNQGDVESAFAKARLMLSSVSEERLASSVYCSKAWGFESDELFRNQVIELTTDIAPLEFLDYTQSVERSIGRTDKTNDGAYQSRAIDIDILFCDDMQLQTPRLTIPHPLLHERRFTLVPLCELWADYVHPRFDVTVAQLLAQCTDNSEVWPAAFK